MQFSLLQKILVMSSVAASFLVPQSISAGCLGCDELTFQFGGFSTGNFGKRQHVNIEGLVGDDFSTKSSDGNFLAGIGYYLKGCNIASARTLFGVNAFYLATTQVTGKVKQENVFTNLSYHYSRTNYPIYFAARALVHCAYCYDVVLDLGVGPNMICTRNFKEKSLDGGITLPDPHPFCGKNTVTFSASAGLGARVKNFFKGYMLEVNYRFFYLGQGELKKTNSQIKNNLRTGQTYANALFFSIVI